MGKMTDSSVNSLNLQHLLRGYERLDYTFSGNSQHQELYVDELMALPRWYGKRERLSEVPLKGNGQLLVRDKRDGRLIYRHSFSTLFQEWLATEESRRLQKS